MLTKQKFSKLHSDVPDKLFKEKLFKIVELHKGIKILKDRIITSKADLVTYFNKNPQLQNTKYNVENYSIKYVNHNANDGITQKLIISGLTQYFKSKGMDDPSKEVTQIMSIIKNNRSYRTVQGIDIRTRGVKTSQDINDDVNDDNII